MRYINPLLLCLILTLIGCSSTQPVKKVSESSSEFDGSLTGDTVVLGTDDTGATQYRVFSKGASGFVPQSKVRENAEERASKFCKQEGKKSKILQETRSPYLQILGNFPRSEIIFICIDDDKKEQQSNKEALYSRLKELKKMQDEGLINKAEYESQKAKLLNE